MHIIVKKWYFGQISKFTSRNFAEAYILQDKVAIMR